MFTNILRVVIAISMFVISVGSWRYQGDIHHMQKKIFDNNKSYSHAKHKALWDKYSKDSNNPIEMREIHLYDAVFRLIEEPKPHPSELIMDDIIKSKKWSRFIPNSKSSTYKLSQKIWISQNLTIEEIMDYALTSLHKAKQTGEYAH